ncbi:MAG: hypothetical protein QOE08_1300, partial [Thermoleophilaceae bacterium]|nr:hypothetical protein [Thermoleophilaceae bacterium]
PPAAGPDRALDPAAVAGPAVAGLLLEPELVIAMTPTTTTITARPAATYAVGLCPLTIL